VKAPRNPMATAPTLDHAKEITHRLVSALSRVSGVESIHYLETENAFSVWVGVNDDDPVARSAVYDFEDVISQVFQNILFDFHVVALPAGRKMEELMSDTQPVFQRTA
jgi:hypothetical protein